jgi:hypothetical protein
VLEQVSAQEFVYRRRAVSLGFWRSLVLNALDHPVVDSFLEFVKSLHLIHTVDQVSDHCPDFFLFFAKRRE